MDLEAAIEALTCSNEPPERQREGLETVRKLLNNIRNNPFEEKFRIVKLTNPAIQKRLFLECVHVLTAAGFSDDGDVLVFRRDPGPDLYETLTLVESLLLSLGGAPGAASSSSSSSAAPAPAPPPPAESKKKVQMQRAEKERSEARQAQATAQQQLATLRQQRAGQYQEQQDVALAQHLSGRAADAPYDAIAMLNASRGATHSFVSCSRCGTSLRYNSATRAQAVLCPCGMLLQPIHMQGQSFAPRAPSDLPVEPGEPVDRENRPRASRGPFITVRGADGETSRLPLHSVLQMVRQHESGRQTGAQDETIESLPTRTYTAAADGGATREEDSKCQICLEPFEEGDELRTLPCFHLFHAKCVDQWLKVNSICPTCRHKVG